MFCIYLRTNSDLCHLQHKLIGFYNQMKIVYSAVRTVSLNKAVCALSLKGLIPNTNRVNLFETSVTIYQSTRCRIPECFKILVGI